MLDARTHARTHGHKGDFILCPMLCIALDRQLRALFEQRQWNEHACSHVVVVWALFNWLRRTNKTNTYDNDRLGQARIAALRRVGRADVKWRNQSKLSAGDDRGASSMCLQPASHECKVALYMTSHKHTVRSGISRHCRSSSIPSALSPARWSWCYDRQRTCRSRDNVSLTWFARSHAGNQFVVCCVTRQHKLTVTKLLLKHLLHIEALCSRSSVSIFGPSAFDLLPLKFVFYLYVCICLPMQLGIGRWIEPSRLQYTPHRYRPTVIDACSWLITRVTRSSSAVHAAGCSQSDAEHSTPPIQHRHHHHQQQQQQQGDTKIQLHAWEWRGRRLMIELLNYWHFMSLLPFAPSQGYSELGW